VSVARSNKKCEQCGSEFRCGVAAADATCWCFDEPHVIPFDEKAQCLCPACLKLAIRDALKKRADKKWNGEKP